MKPIALFFILFISAFLTNAQVLYTSNGDGIYRYNLATSNLVNISSKDNYDHSISMHYDVANKQILLWKRRSVSTAPDTLTTIDATSGNIISRDTNSALNHMTRIVYDGRDTFYGANIFPQDGISYYDRVNKKYGKCFNVNITAIGQTLFDSVRKRFFCLLPSSPGQSMDTILTIDLKNNTATYDAVPYSRFNCMEYSEKDDKIYGVGSYISYGFYSFDLSTKTTTIVSTLLNVDGSGNNSSTFDQVNNRYIIHKVSYTVPGADTFYVYNIDSNILIKKLNIKTKSVYNPIYSGEVFDDVNTSISTVEMDQFVVYPNPATDKLFISAKLSGNSVVRDLSGKMLIEKTIIPGYNQIDISRLSPATYIIFVEMGDMIYSRYVVKK